MRRILTLSIALLLGAVFSINAQVQRKVLLEHFTQASCGPCALYNPGMQSIVNAYPDRIVPVKYQVWWPGSDPMYNHNTADVQARVAYYPPSFGVPHSQIDGAWWGGHPANWTIATINQRYAITSPFEIEISHSIPATQDSVYVTMVIRSPQAWTGSAIEHIVVEEEHIHFTSSPGSNGETDFHNVMKKMLPTNAGTALPSTWAAGDSMVLQAHWAFANVYNVEEIAVAAFIQDPVTKWVHQAEYSPPLPPSPFFDYDVASLELSGLPGASCTGNISPDLKIKNMGAFDLTSLDIKYQVNNGTVGTYSWTGNLPFYSETSINIPGITFAVQTANELKVWVSNPNGQSDQNGINDTVTAGISQATAVANNIDLVLRTDNSPGEITWELLDDLGNVLYSGGPYTQNQTVYNHSFSLPATGCYTFVMYDAGGDGICCSNGVGFYRLSAASSPNFITGGTFTSEERNELEVLTVGLERAISAQFIEFLPNPFSNEAILRLSLPHPMEVQMEVFDLSGKQMMLLPYRVLPAGVQELTLDGRGLAPGMYLLQVMGEGFRHQEKIHIIR
jgi:hypothetical protein